MQRIAKATEAWTSPATARLALAYGGTRSAGSEDVDCSSVNAGAGLITFEDPYNEISGSVIAIGGGCSGGPSHVVSGHTFSSITHAFVIFNNASELSAGIRSPDSFMRVLAHEIGHGIGLGHTCDPSNGIPCTTAMQTNLMYPSCCSSLMPLPPAIGPDDLAGIAVHLSDAGGAAAGHGHGLRRSAGRVGNPVRSESEQRHRTEWRG